MIRKIMEFSYVICPQSGKGVKVLDCDALDHFRAWTFKEVKALVDNKDEGLRWPHACFGMFSARSHDGGQGVQLDALASHYRSVLASWRRSRAIFVVPDYIGKFASIETMLFGKKFSVFNKWAFLEGLTFKVDVYGVGSENYFLSCFPGDVSYLHDNGESRVTFFDVDKVALSRFFYARNGDVLKPRKSEVIISDAEVDYAAGDVLRLFQQASKGVAIKVLLKNETFASSIEAFVGCAGKKRWDYFIRRVS